MYESNNIENIQKEIAKEETLSIENILKQSTICFPLIKKLTL